MVRVPLEVALERNCEDGHLFKVSRIQVANA